MVTVKFRRDLYDAAVFDMDGVVTDTARLHAAAWKQTFDAYLESRPLAGSPQRRFDDRDYVTYVDGKDRDDGAASFLASRGIDVPRGAVDDGPDRDTAWGVANRKNLTFQQMMADHGVEAFASSVALVRALRRLGVGVAIISASRNCAHVLDAAGIGDLFDVRVDGLEAQRLGLPGKPSPAVFLEAARRLGVDAERAVVVEDAIAGTQAGRAGGFGLVIGVARSGDGAALKANGADVVVHDLADVHVDGRSEGLVVLDAPDGWMEWLDGISAACGTGMAVAAIHSSTAPTILPTGLVVGAGTLLVASTNTPEYLIFDQTGVRAGTRAATCDALQWTVAEMWALGIGASNVLVVRGDPTSALTDQRQRRQRRELPLVVPQDGWTLGREGFDATGLRVNASIFALADGRVGTSGAPMADHPDTHRWVLVGNTYVGTGPETHLLTGPIAMHLPFDMAPLPTLRRSLDMHAGLLYEEVGTSKGMLRSVRFSSLARPGTVVFRARCPLPRPGGAALLAPADDPVFDDGTDGEATWMRVAATPGGIAAAAADLTAGSVVDRIAVYDADPERLPDASEEMVRLKEKSSAGFDSLLAEHRQAWSRRWEDADISIDGDDDLQTAVRFALFHLMASVPDSGEAAIGARGLTGTSYRGHVFWDADTFTLPFLAATHPGSARAMLEYRIRRLPEAISVARALGRRGARFPWESARSGYDVTPTSARDRTGNVVEIHTGQAEEHIVAEVAWAACCYTDWTDDQAFAEGPLVELLVETARYWASRISSDGHGAHILGVIGPDEYHEPVDDNAFTNVMARWNLRRAADAVQRVAGSQVAASETDGWRQLADGLVDGYNAETGIYEQFSGFNALEPLLIAEIAPRRPIAADLLLGAGRVSRSQVLKQADVLMLHHLVPEEVECGSLGPNLRFYEPRTAHGSSLSPGVHASLLARAGDCDAALTWLRVASRIDLDDLTGTTAGGLHLATMGSLWQALVYGLAGLHPHAGRLQIDPRLPQSWRALEVRVLFHGSRVLLRIERQRFIVSASAPTSILVDAKPYEVGSGGLEFERRDHKWEVST